MHPRRQPRQRQLGGYPGRRVLPPAAAGRVRRVRVGRGSALVHGRGGHDGLLLGRLRRAPGGGSRRGHRERGRRLERGSEPPRRLRRVRHGRARQRRHALDGRFSTGREPRVGRVATRLARRAARAGVLLRRDGVAPAGLLPGSPHPRRLGLRRRSRLRRRRRGELRRRSVLVGEPVGQQARGAQAHARRVGLAAPGIFQG